MYKPIAPKEPADVVLAIRTNGFKTSERTTYGSMDDKEIGTSFARCRYQARLVRRDLDRIDKA